MKNVFTGQIMPCVLAFADSKGNPAAVDGVPVWTSSDETVLQILVEADGMSATVATVAPGTARITVQADADLGAGVLPITGVSEDVVVTPNPNTFASVVALTLGTAVDAP